jgi:hypothetical protein
MLLPAVSKYTILNLPTISCKSDFLHRHSIPTNKTSRPHNGNFFGIVRPYKVVTVRCDFHDKLSTLKNFFPRTNGSEANLSQTRSTVHTDVV